MSSMDFDPFSHREEKPLLREKGLEGQREGEGREGLEAAPGSSSTPLAVVEVGA